MTTCVLALASAPSGALTGGISGTVVDHQGTPACAVVTAHRPDGSVAARTVPGDDGRYQFAALTPGAYRIRFAECPRYPGPPPTHASEWFDDKGSFEEAHPVVLGVNQSVGAVDAQLDIGGSIGGRITTESGSSVPGMSVEVFDRAGRLVGSSITDADGRYVVAPLFTGAFKVFASDHDSGYGSAPRYHGRVWYPSTTAPGSAGDVHVVVGKQTAGIDFVVIDVPAPIAAGRAAAALLGKGEAGEAPIGIVDTGEHSSRNPFYVRGSGSGAIGFGPASLTETTTTTRSHVGWVESNAIVHRTGLFPLYPEVFVEGLQVRARATCLEVDGDFSIGRLYLLRYGDPHDIPVDLLEVSEAVAPNSRFALPGIGEIVLNEQTRTATGLTMVGVRLTTAAGEISIGFASARLEDCPANNGVIR